MNIGNQRVREIVARLVNAALRSPHASDAIADEIILGLRSEGYVILSKADFKEAVDAAAKQITEALATMVPPPEMKQ